MKLHYCLALILHALIIIYDSVYISNIFYLCRCHSSAAATLSKSCLLSTNFKASTALNKSSNPFSWLIFKQVSPNTISGISGISNSCLILQTKRNNISYIYIRFIYVVVVFFSERFSQLLYIYFFVRANYNKLIKLKYYYWILGAE